MDMQRMNKAAGCLLRAGFTVGAVIVWRRWALRQGRRWAHYTRTLYGVKGF